MDPYVVATLLGYTGHGPPRLARPGRHAGQRRPVPAARPVRVGAADNDVRADALAEAASLAFDALLGGALPEPIELARDLAPLTSDRRLLVWSAHPEEQELLETVGIAGDMPALDGADGWSFSVSNAGGNKIDASSQRKAGYDATTDPDTGVTTGTMRIELTNTAPAEGLPKYVIGNRDRQAEGHEQPAGVAVQPARARPGHGRRHGRRASRRAPRTAGTSTGSPSTSPPARRRPSRRRCPARSPTPTSWSRGPSRWPTSSSRSECADRSFRPGRPGVAPDGRKLGCVRSRSSAGGRGAATPSSRAGRGPTT